MPPCGRPHTTLILGPNPPPSPVDNYPRRRGTGKKKPLREVERQKPERRGSHVSHVFARAYSTTGPLHPATPMPPLAHL